MKQWDCLAWKILLHFFQVELSNGERVNVFHQQGTIGACNRYEGIQFENIVIKLERLISSLVIVLVAQWDFNL